MTDFVEFLTVVICIYIILSIVILVKWWKMTNDVKEIKRKINDRDNFIAILAIEGKDAAEKAAIKLLIDKLLAVYFDEGTPNHYKFTEMNKIFSKYSGLFDKLNFNVPPYLRTVKDFITYMNDLTG